MGIALVIIAWIRTKKLQNIYPGQL